MRKYIIISVSIISFIIGVVVNNTYKENELETIKKLSNIEDIYVKKSKDSEIVSIYQMESNEENPFTGVKLW